MSTPAPTLDMHQTEIEALAKKKGISPSELMHLARVTFGSIGGKSGTGESKKRSPAHYAKMVRKRNEKRAAERAKASKV